MSEGSNVEQAEIESDSVAGVSKAAHLVVGHVISDKMQKTITVRVERVVKHPLYKKYVKRSSKYHAHDENNECRIGDKVSIKSCRPISKTKAWRVHEILERAK